MKSIIVYFWCSVRLVKAAMENNTILLKINVIQKKTHKKHNRLINNIQLKKIRLVESIKCLSRPQWPQKTIRNKQFQARSVGSCSKQ